ncbi:MFS transporter [Stachybotrys elegans]|uniref:MFS transporter n=1 Tax=Stachybotrys elegans TaxID=80388 RepID=A0A8K0WUC9_9HYPO|nr:MFS transporter [Stachybotrys elegans]
MEASAVAETEPLIRAAENEDAQRDADHQDQLDEHEDPLLWPMAFKRSIVTLLAIMAFTVTFNCISVVPISNSIIADLNGGHTSKSAAVLLVTIWELGEAAGPLLVGPLSEAFGRYPVLNAGNFLFIAATALSALSPSVPTLIAARALTGLAVTGNVLNPAVIGDIFAPEQRGSAMSFVQLAPLIGGAIGPAISGAITQTVGWRVVFWMSVGLAAACELVFLTYFRETYHEQIKRARNKKLHVEAPVESRRERAWRLLENVSRPIVVFTGSGVLMALALFGGVAFAHFYVMSVTLPQILEEIYGLSPALAGLSMVAPTVGSTIAVLICNQTIDRIYIKLRDRNGGKGKPEHRLPIAIVGGLLIGPTVAMYGWIAHLRLPVALLLSSVALLDGSLMFAILPLYAYAVDAFGKYSASAITGLIVTRCLMGTFLPLLVTPMVDGFGWGWGFTIMGAATAALSPIPFFVMRYGGRWREGSVYSRDA